MTNRQKISERLLADLAVVWEASGKEVLERLAKDDPGKLATIAYGLLPKDEFISVEQKTPGNLAPEAWAALRRVLDLIRAAGADGDPRDVFGLRASELADLRWDQIDFDTANLAVRRAKKGYPALTRSWATRCGHCAGYIASKSPSLPSCSPRSGVCLSPRQGLPGLSSALVSPPDWASRLSPPYAAARLWLRLG